MPEGSAELRRVVDLLEDATWDFVSTRDRIEGSGYFEAPTEAWALSELMVRNIRAVGVLARTDVGLAPAAWANARSVFDAAVRILWLLFPADRFDCEMRWLGLLREYERFYERILDVPGLSEGERKRYESELLGVRRFREGVALQAPVGYTTLPGIPSTRDMVREIGVPGMYRLYIEGSQFAHGTMVGTRSFRRNLGTMREFGDFITEPDWLLTLRTCWICLHIAANFVVDRLSSSGSDYDLGASHGEAIDAAFRSLVYACFPDERGL